MTTLVTDDNIGKSMESLINHPVWVTDLETTGLNPRRDQICGWVLKGWDPSTDHTTDEFYIPTGHTSGNVSPENIPKLVKAAQERPMIGWNNALFDTTFMWELGMKRDVTVVDVMLNHHLLNENEAHSEAGLKVTAGKYVDHNADAAEKELEALLAANLLASKADMYRLPPERTCRYGGDDVRLTLAMHKFHLPHLASQDLVEVARGVSKYALVIAAAIKRGLLLDIDGIRDAMAWSRSEMMRVTRLAWEEYQFKNLSSAQKVGKWLGMKSTREEDLELLDDPKAQLVLEFRRHQKAVGSYYIPFLDVQEDGVLHPDLRVAATISGRLACRRPNVQGLPRDTTVYKVKKNIVARPGYVLLQADYRQAEVILCCHFSNDAEMRRIILSGKKIHQIVADDLDIPYFAGKTMNLSAQYGIGPKAVANKLHISYDEAVDYLDGWHRKFPGVRKLLQSAERQAKNFKYIKMYTGRRRHYNRGYKTPTHKAASNLIQGTVAELIREAQTALDDELRVEDVHQLLQTHDSCVMEVPEDRVLELAPRVNDIMRTDRFSVPMEVDITVGPNLEEQTKCL